MEVSWRGSRPQCDTNAILLARISPFCYCGIRCSPDARHLSRHCLMRPKLPEFGPGLLRLDDRWFNHSLNQPVIGHVPTSRNADSEISPTFIYLCEMWRISLTGLIESSPIRLRRLRQDKLASIVREVPVDYTYSTQCTVPPASLERQKKFPG